MWTPSGLISDRAIRIEEGRIRSIEALDQASGPVHDLLLPGFVNAHSHAFQRAIRGHVQRGTHGRADFWTWRDRMYAVANRLDPDGIEAVSALAFLEMAEAGVTHVGEFHYLHHQPGGSPYDAPDELAHRVVRAARSVGLRITLLRVAYARAGSGRPASPEQRRFVDARPDDVLDALNRLRTLEADPGVTIGLAAHSVRALDRDWLEALSSWPGLVHAHVSEQPAENEACLAEYGRSPLAMMETSGLLRPGFTAVHLTWPLEGDVDRLVAHGGGVCACPTTELDLGDGFVPAEVLARVPVSLGTDSHASIDPLLEARSLELHARAAQGRRGVLATDTGESLAERLLTSATSNGTAALGSESHGVTLGAPADLVAIDLSAPAAAGVTPLEAAAFVATPEWITDVWVAGRAIVTGGRHPLRQEVLASALPYLRTGA